MMEGGSRRSLSPTVSRILRVPGYGVAKRELIVVGTERTCSPTQRDVNSISGLSRAESLLPAFLQIPL